LNRYEDATQKAIVNYLRNVLRGSAMVLHIANNPRSARDGARLKAMGLVAGAPDLLVVLPHGKGCFIEVKSPKGRVQEAQHSFSFTCQALGWPWFVARSVDDVKLAFKALGIPTREADEWIGSQAPKKSVTEPAP
jgi:hypothetical protein